MNDWVMLEELLEHAGLLVVQRGGFRERGIREVSLRRRDSFGFPGLPAMTGRMSGVCQDCNIGCGVACPPPPSPNHGIAYTAFIKICRSRIIFFGSLLKLYPFL